MAIGDMAAASAADSGISGDAGGDDSDVNLGEGGSPAPGNASPRSRPRSIGRAQKPPARPASAAEDDATVQKPARRQTAEGGDEALGADDVEDDESTEALDGDAEGDEPEWTAEKAKEEREAIEKRKKAIDRSHIALTEKRRKLAQREHAVVEHETRIQREMAAASKYFEQSSHKIQAFDRLKEMARENDPGLIEALGIDLEKLSLHFAQDGTGMAADRKTKSELEAIRKQFDDEKRAREQLEQRYRAEQSAQAEAKAFVRLARSLDDCPLVGRVAGGDPDALIEEAVRLRNKAMARGEDLSGERLVRRLEKRFSRLAEKSGQAYDSTQREERPATSRNSNPTGQRPPGTKAERGMGSDPKRRAPQESVDPSSLSREQLDELALRKLDELWR